MTEGGRTARGRPRSLALAWLLLAACAPTETGNPATLALSAHSSDPSAVSVEGGSGLVVEHAWIFVGDVRLVRAASCDDATDAVELSGPFAVDLVAAPIALVFEATDDRYCRVRVPLQRASAGPTAPWSGWSVWIEGRTEAGVPFTLASRAEPELDVQAEGAPFRLARPLVLSFDVARWFDGVDVRSGEMVDGVITIDPSTNADLLDVFESNLEDALELYEDDDEDGERDDGEARVGRSGDDV